MLKKLTRNSVIPAVTIGSIIEWYEIGLYIYWAPLIGKLFYGNLDETISVVVSTVAIFAIGFIARPTGGLIAGWIADRKGRKWVFFATIVGILIPTVLIGIMPTYSTWSFGATTTVLLLRVLQGIPAGG